jgi:hypothetical protein
MIDRKEVGTIAGVAVANGPVYWLLVYVEVLGEGGIEKLHNGDIEARPARRLALRWGCRGRAKPLGA